MCLCLPCSFSILSSYFCCLNEWHNNSPYVYPSLDSCLYEMPTYDLSHSSVDSMYPRICLVSCSIAMPASLLTSLVDALLMVLTYIYLSFLIKKGILRNQKDLLPMIEHLWVKCVLKIWDRRRCPRQLCTRLMASVPSPLLRPQFQAFLVSYLHLFNI